MSRFPALFGVFGLVLGCQEGLLSEREMELLETMRIERALLPADPSNSYAELPGAARLGKKLYFEARFSGPLGPYNVPGTNGSLGVPGETGKVGCASCHNPAMGGADHRSLPNATSLGAGYTSRNSPSVINAAYSPLWQFWDGRADSLWSQALGPPEGSTEDNGSRLTVSHFIYAHYRDEYVAVFGPLPELSDTTRFPPAGKPGDPAFDGMSAADREAINRVYANFGKAIAAYERRLVSPAFEPSAFDRFMAGDAEALPPQAIRGAKLFVGRAGCFECHRGALMSDFGFHNVGTPQEGQYVYAVDVGRLAGMTTVKADPFNRASVFSDRVLGEHLAALSPADLNVGQFKTPSLRNVTKTAPYMHDGIYQTLWDVVDHYNFGGGTGTYSGTKDPTVSPLLLQENEMADLVEFLRALEDGPPLPTQDFPEGLTTRPTLPP